MMGDSDKRIIVELDVQDGHFGFTSSITEALDSANAEYREIEEQLEESLETIKKLTPECDKLDYILAASSGALCGVIDIFLVGKPGESPVGDITDKWFEERTKAFARLCGWKDNGKGLSSAIAHLEKTFKVPYDQTGTGGAAKEVFGLSMSNHHFKSLGHNPTLLGLFFSILDQFSVPTQSHFVTGGKLIALQDADSSFELRGNNVPSKLFCAFVNWFGHLVSDMSGSSGSKGRGMGIPSPFWSWTNDIVVIKEKLNIPASGFDKGLNELALKIYEEGYDFRFQSAQAIPVFVNEILVRFIYSVRRMIKYYASTEKEERSKKRMWKECEPFSNATVKRMLTVAHGTFCLIDAGDAVVRGFASGGGSFNVAEFAMRLNIIGVGRFAFSLYGEVRRGADKREMQRNVYILSREKTIVADYIEGLKKLAEKYDDKELLTFVDDFNKSGMYECAFQKSVELARKREVPEEQVLESKASIDKYFVRGK